MTAMPSSPKMCSLASVISPSVVSLAASSGLILREAMPMSHCRASAVNAVAEPCAAIAIEDGELPFGRTPSTTFPARWLREECEHPLRPDLSGRPRPTKAPACLQWCSSRPAEKSSSVRCRLKRKQCRASLPRRVFRPVWQSAAARPRARLRWSSDVDKRLERGLRCVRERCLQSARFRTWDK